MEEVQGPIMPEAHHRNVGRALQRTWDMFERAGPDYKAELAYYLLREAVIACQFVKDAHKQVPHLFFEPYLPVVRSGVKSEDREAHLLWEQFKKYPKSSFRLEDVAQGPFFDRLMEYLRRLYRLRQSPSMLKNKLGKQLAELPELSLSSVKPWARTIADYFLDDAIRHNLVSPHRSMSVRKRRAQERLRRAEGTFNALDDTARVRETRLKLRREKLRKMEPTRSEYRRAFVEQVETRLKSSLRKDTKPAG